MPVKPERLQKITVPPKDPVGLLWLALPDMAPMECVVVAKRAGGVLLATPTWQALTTLLE